MAKKRYDYDDNNWYRLKKMWRKFKILRGKGDILEQQKIALEIQKCQRDLNLQVANFDELQSIVLWE